MPITKVQQDRIYNYGIDQGKAILHEYINGDDVIDILVEAFSQKEGKRVEKSTREELELAVRNFRDGVEDGIKSQLYKECGDYIGWLRREMK
jgi:hypothetical protein